MHASREPTPRCYIRRCQTRYSEPSLYLYGHIHRVRGREEERERERERRGGEGEQRHMCPSIYTRGHIRAIHYAAPVAHTHAHTCTHSDALTTRMCVACTALATHTEIYRHKCLDGIRWCGQCCLSFCASQFLSLSLSLSLSLYPSGDTWRENYSRSVRDGLHPRRSVSRWHARLYTGRNV